MRLNDKVGGRAKLETERVIDLLCAVLSGELQFVNIISANKVAILCSVNLLHYLNIACTGHSVESTHKTILTCTRIYIATSQMHKISSYMFRHFMSEIIRESSQ